MTPFNPRLVGAVIVAFGVVGVSPAAAQCTTIGGKGTGGSLDSARFQAYEAMLQGTDVGMWANWMVSGAKVGVAPGYRVDGLRFKCGPGGMGEECRARATFCKKA